MTLSMFDAYTAPQSDGHRCPTHRRHDTAIVPTDIGEFIVYDWRRYQGTVGYCTGNDAVSETIEMGRRWEWHGTALMLDVLAGGNPAVDVVLDFGTHIGWYTINAALAGYRVLGFDGDAENVDVVRRNAAVFGVADRVRVSHAWVDETLPPFPTSGRVRFAKIDLEGADRHAVAAIEPLLAEHLVDAMAVEISPVFNDTYPDLVERICGYGYDACWVPHDGFADLDVFARNPVEAVRRFWTLTPHGRRSAVASVPQSDLIFFPTES